MTTLQIFAPPPRAMSKQDMSSTLRPYQVEAVAAIRKELAEQRGTLALMATGTGKTQVACEVIRGWRGRCLFVAHRDELIRQAARRIEEFCGGRVDIEQAESRADHVGSLHVVASVQSLSRPSRLERFDPGEFSLIVCDEVHHATATTYRRVLDYFSTAKILGLTATPDRADKEALGQILDSVAYQYEIDDAIRDGWLCPIKIRSIEMPRVDFSRVRTTAGDLNQGDLDAIMAVEENLHAVAKPTVECAGERKTLVFTTSVHNAHRLAEIINRYAGEGRAFAVDGETETDERRRLLRDFSAGKFQYLCNVGVLTEGYDEPGIACVALGRPTKSRSLYTQMLGRGTRGGARCLVPGKADLLVLDFVGNAGRHDIVCASDILGGKISDKDRAAAQAQIEKAGLPMSLDEALAAAREQEERERGDRAAADKRRGVTAEVIYQVVDASPWDMFAVRRDYLHERYGYDPATDKQLAALRKMLGEKNVPEKLGKSEASRMMGALVKRIDANSASYKQIKLLAKHGFDARAWEFGAARKAIDAISGNGWRVPPWLRAQLAHEREPGEDG